MVWFPGVRGGHGRGLDKWGEVPNRSQPPPCNNRTVITSTRTPTGKETMKHLGGGVSWIEYCQDPSFWITPPSNSFWEGWGFVQNPQVLCMRELAAEGCPKYEGFLYLNHVKSWKLSPKFLIPIPEPAPPPETTPPLPDQNVPIHPAIQQPRSPSRPYLFCGHYIYLNRLPHAQAQ